MQTKVFTLLNLLRRRFTQHQTTVSALIVRGGAVAAGFAVTFLIGRQYGPAANGQFALVTQTAMFLAVVGLVGLDVSVVRHYAKAISNNTKLCLTSVLLVIAIGLALMVAIAIGMWLGGDLIWTRLFGDAVPRTMLLVLCILLIGRGGTTLFGGMLRSQHRFTLGQMIASLTMPLTTAVALISGLATSVEGALWATAAGGLASILIGAIAMRRHVGRGPETLAIPLRPVLASSLPLWGVGIALNIGDWYGLAVAAQMLGAAEAGLYRVAVQIAATLQIVTMTVYSIYTAKISTAFHAGNRTLVALYARSAVKVSIAISAPLAAALAIGSPFLLGQIGPDFGDAFRVVLVLIAGNLAYTVLGPSGIVLAMSGNERINLIITIMGTGTLLVLVPIAARFFGIEGIAAAISLVMLLRNLAALSIVRFKLKINIWTGSAYI